MSKRLRKSKDEQIDGVCAGIAEYFNIDPTFIRILFLVLLLATTLPVGLIYVILMFTLPDAA